MRAGAEPQAHRRGETRQHAKHAHARYPEMIRRTWAPSVPPCRPTKSATHAGQVQIAASCFSLPRRNEMSPAWRIAERRRPPGSQPQDDLATGVALTLRTRDHTSVEEVRTAGDKLPADSRLRARQRCHADSSVSMHHDPPHRGPAQSIKRGGRSGGSAVVRIPRT